MDGLENFTFKVVDNDEGNKIEDVGFSFEQPNDEITTESSEQESIESIEDESQEQVINNQEVHEDEEQSEEVDSNLILGYLRDKLGLDIDDLNNLTKKEENSLPEDVKAYLKYREDTGRSFQDFLETQKDWSSENEDVLLRKYISEKNPYFDEDDINAEIEDKYSYDEDFDAESDVKKKQREKKKILAEAQDFFKEKSEKYKIPLESNEDYIPLEYKEAKNKLQEIEETHDLVSQAEEKAVNYFRNKTEELFSKDFKGFEFKIDNEEFVFKPSNIEESKNSQMNIGNFIDKHLGDDGLIKDVKGYHKALNMAMNPDQVAKHFFELGKAKAIEEIAKDRKNIDTGFLKTNDGNKQTTTFRVLNPDVQQTFR